MSGMWPWRRAWHEAGHVVVFAHYGAPDPVRVVATAPNGAVTVAAIGVFAGIAYLALG